jgi:hypothetical protein
MFENRYDTLYAGVAASCALSHVGGYISFTLF